MRPNRQLWLGRSRAHALFGGSWALLALPERHWLRKVALPLSVRQQDEVLGHDLVPVRPVELLSGEALDSARCGQEALQLPRVDLRVDDNDVMTMVMMMAIMMLMMVMVTMLMMMTMMMMIMTIGPARPATLS